MWERATDGKILVTTLLCPTQAPKAGLKALYCERWQVELDFRHIKTTLGMEMLNCKTPTMAQIDPDASSHEPSSDDRNPFPC